MSTPDQSRSIPELFGDAIEQLGKLVQNEIELARAELAEKVSQAAMGAGLLAAAAILVIPVLVLLLIALAIGLGELGLSPLQSHLAAAGVGILISAALALIGLSYLKPKNLTPNVTIRQIERDVAAVKEISK